MLILRIKKHWLALVLALTIGLIYASHHFFIPAFFSDEAGGAYQPITPNEYYDESLFYAPKAAAVFWGREFGGDFSTAEHGGGPSIASPLNSLILGTLMKLTGSVKSGLIISDFLLPAIIFLLMYLLAYEIISAPTPASVFALIFIMAPKLALALPPTNTSAFNEIWSAIAPFSRPSLIHFSEFDEPKITFVFAALFAYSLMRALRRGGRRNTVFAGLSFGLLFYTYPYDWAAAATALVLMAAIFFIQRHPYLTRRVGVIFGIGAAISIFYWLNWLELSKLSPDVITRLGGEIGRFFRLESVWKHYIRIVILVPILWYALRHINKKAWVFLSAYLASFAVAVNIQVITGFNAQPDHWYRVQFLPVALAIFLIAYRVYLLYFWGKAGRLWYGLFMAWILGSNLYGQYAYAEKHAPAFYIPKDRYESYEWLRVNTPKDSVVGTISFEINPAIQLFSHNRLFLPFGLGTPASNSELWERFEIMAGLFGLNSEEFKNLILKENGLYYLTVEQWGDKHFDAAFGDYDRKIHPDELGDRLLAYNFYLKSKLNIDKYRMDYIYFDKKNSVWGRDPEIGKKIFENSTAVIYKL